MGFQSDQFMIIRRVSTRGIKDNLLRVQPRRNRVRRRNLNRTHTNLTQPFGNFNDSHVTFPRRVRRVLTRSVTTRTRLFHPFRRSHYHFVLTGKVVPLFLSNRRNLSSKVLWGVTTCSRTTRAFVFRMRASLCSWVYSFELWDLPGRPIVFSRRHRPIHVPRPNRMEPSNIPSRSMLFRYRNGIVIVRCRLGSVVPTPKSSARQRGRVNSFLRFLPIVLRGQASVLCHFNVDQRGPNHFRHFCLIRHVRVNLSIVGVPRDVLVRGRATIRTIYGGSSVVEHTRPSRVRRVTQRKGSFGILQGKQVKGVNRVAFLNRGRFVPRILRKVATVRRE